MTPLEFLAVVLPSAGLGKYCVVELNHKQHVYADTLEELQPQIDEWNNHKYDIFFAVSTFKSARKAEEAEYIKAFFVDLDGYDTKKDAAMALDSFLQKTGLDEIGRPWIVSSGGGLHCYWPLTDAIPVGIWKPIAENLKRLAAQEDFKIDMTVTADSARILRVPGTHNYKKKYRLPRPVKIMTKGDMFELDKFSKVIYDKVEAPAVVAPVSAPLLGQRPKNSTVGQVKMLQDSYTLFSNFEGECGQIADYIATAQEDGKEPIWRGLLSWAKVCEDGDEKAIWLSDMHPYPMHRMQQKLAEIKGPYACIKMDSENPGICTKCKHWGKITNPLVLGREIKTDNTQKQIALTPVAEFNETELDEEETYGPEDDDLPVAPSITRPEPPRGYSYGEHGGVYCTRAIEDEITGKKSKSNIQLLPYDLFVVDLLKMDNDHLVHMAACRPEGVETLNFPQKSIVSKDETLKWLAAQNIVSTFVGYDKVLYEYVSACVRDASQRKKPITVPFQFGWQTDGSFVYNNRVFGSDGRETQVPMPGLENINRNTAGKGDLATWRRLWETIFINKPNMEMALAVCLDSFGSALMRFTPVEGFVWHIGSRWSGTGKSLVLSAKAGVWGHPLRYRTGKGTSPVAMQQRAGLLGSLPLLVDEITSAQRKDMEWAPTFIFDFAEAQGKERMESHANKERLNNSTWRSSCSMTSNEKLTDYMAGARKHSSNGELLRMLEWTPHVKLQWTPEERRILQDLKGNYGVAGEAWVRWLVKNQDVVEKIMQKVNNHLKKVMNFNDDERFWHANCTAIVASAILLRKEYANILDVEINKVITSLKELVEKARVVIGSSVRTAEDVLNTYISDNYGSFIVIKKSDGRLLASWGEDGAVDKSITKSKVLGRVEHGLLRPGYREFYIEEGMLKKHCVSMSFGYDEFKAQMEAMFPVTYVKKDMLAKTNGPAMRVNVMHITFKEDVFDGNTLSLDEASKG